MLFSLEEKIACLKRELLLRKKVYPNRVATRRMTQKQAYREIELLSQILDDYLAIEASQQLPGIFQDG